MENLVQNQLKSLKFLILRRSKKWDSKVLSFTKWEHEIGIFEASYYLPVGIKITADVRLKLVQTVGNNYSKFLYCDTDSIAFTDDFKIQTGKDLGEWKIENEGVEMLVAGKKRYLMVKNGNIEKVAFASYKLKNIQSKLSFKTFYFWS